MPWYMNPAKTCGLLNRIASRFPAQQKQELRSTLDQITEMI